MPDCSSRGSCGAHSGQGHAPVQRGHSQKRLRMASMKRWPNECQRHMAQKGVRQCWQQMAIWLMCARRRQ